MFGRWRTYVPVASRMRQAASEVAKRKAKGIAVSPVVITGSKIATTFWGISWCENLESYSDYANRLPRGRTYVRNGSVVDLQISPGTVKALVSGSSLYKVELSITALAGAKWKSICEDCSGGIDSLVELLQGRFSKGVMQRMCKQNDGLFPSPREIQLTCSCPDSAYMCKHICAVLYGVGVRLDHQPELLFRLRAVDEKELIAHAGKAIPGSKSAPTSTKALDAGADLADLFGLELADRPASESPRAVAAGKKPSTTKVEAPRAVTKKAATKKAAAKNAAAKKAPARKAAVNRRRTPPR